MKRILLLFYMLSCVMIHGVIAQRIVTGQVTDETGETIPGANVIIKGTTSGTSTDFDGNYRLEVPDEAEVLVFTFVGLQEQEVIIGDQTEIDVRLVSDATELAEVIVVGYGTQLKQDLTGNIAKVKGEDIQNIPVNSFESALQGRTTGVQIEQGSGKLGEGIKIRVRGSSSISAGNQPLYVIDGILVTSGNQGIPNNQPTNPVADINFNDIESIEVLKDASAAAIYGSRASNGVIIITTKRGAAGKTQIDLSYQHGISEPTGTRDWLNAAEYRELYTESVLRSFFFGIDPVTATEVQQNAARQFLENSFIAGFNSDLDTDTDWQALAFNENAGFQQLDLSASGGNENTTFYTGISYNDQEGILVNNSFSRLSGRLNLDQKVSDKLNFGVGMNIVRSVLDRVSDDNAFSTPMQLVALAPTQRARLDDGTGNPNTIYYNGLIEFDNATSTSTVDRTLANINANYTIVDGLTFRAEFGIDILDQQEDNYKGRVTLDGAPAGSGESRALRVLNYTTTSFFTYDKVVAENSDLNIVLGTSYQESVTNITNLQALGFPTDELNTIANAASPQTISSSEETFSFLSYFSRINYKLNNKYLLGLSGRIDGSSKFGRENRYGFFPAASAGWILSDESFFGAGEAISFLKFRASYGLTGNTPEGNYAHLGVWTGSNYTTRSGIRPWRLPSPLLGWENTTQLNVGFDFGFVNDRITGEVDYYSKNTSNLLLSRPLPAISGFTSIFENVGELENQGVELVINTLNFVKDFSWSTNFNIAFNQNKITKLNSDEDIIAGVNRVREGQPIGVFVMTEYAGVNPANGHALYYLNRDPTSTEIANSEAIQVNHLGDRYVTNDPTLAEEVVMGNPNPDFTGGLNNTISYKGVDLNVFFTFVVGNEVFNDAGSFQSNSASDFLDNQTKDQLNRWRQPGDITDVPAADFFGDFYGNSVSSRYLQDASYVRLRTLSVGYNFSSSLTERLKIRNARVYIMAQNLLTFTNYDGWDPEVNVSGTADLSTTSQNLIQGRDFYTAPQARTYTIGLKIGI